MRKKLIIFGGIIAVGLFAALTFLKPGSSEEGGALFATAEKGEFTVEVTTTGELSAEKSTKIMGPIAARDYGIRQMTVQRLVEEGTQVRQGDFVAELDKSELYDKTQTEKDQLDAQVAEYDNAKIDTALTLRAERDKLINLDYQIVEKQLQLEQSQYEPPATIKKYENELEKLKRDVIRANENYELKIEQAKAKMIEETADLKRRQDRYNRMVALLSDFTIRAPQDGMVIYAKGGFGGDRIIEGSTVSPWNPQVAELPDLSSMISTTFINEVDIRKVKNGQEVELGLDAFPEKQLSGRVIRVARVGQQNPNSDAKVFEVVVRLNERDRDLRPSMTTSNVIVTKQLDEVVHIPLECLHVFNDSINYVVKKGGLAQEVHVGLTNSNEAEIIEGIDEGEVIYMSMPANLADKEPSLLASRDGKRMEKYEINEVEEDEDKWEMPDGSPMPEQIIQRFKDRGVSAADAKEQMKRFTRGRSGGGQRGGGSGGAKPSTSGGSPNQ